MTTEELNGRILVLCVDRDDDIGQKTGYKGPVIGKEENLKVAERLLLEDPEESDANAVFGAIKIYNELMVKGEKLEIVTVTGHKGKGFKADKEINRQLDEIQKKISIKGAIFVSDGADDEYIIPIIQSRFPIISVERVIVQQSKEIETTYIILLRYLKRYLSDPSFTRIFLGIPGIFFVVAAILYLLNMLRYISVAFLFIMGFTLIFKGFKIEGFSHYIVTGKIEIFTMLSGMLIIISSIYLIYSFIITTTVYSLSYLLAESIIRYMWITILGLAVWFSGGVIEGYIKKLKVFWDRLVLLAILIAMYPLLLWATKLFLVEFTIETLFYLLMYFLIGVTGISIVFLIAWKKRKGWS